LDNCVKKGKTKMTSKLLKKGDSHIEKNPVVNGTYLGFFFQVLPGSSRAGNAF
jgi:hypothetical protein